jgi:hypothetical protein
MLNVQARFNLAEMPELISGILEAQYKCNICAMPSRTSRGSETRVLTVAINAAN